MTNGKPPDLTRAELNEVLLGLRFPEHPVWSGLRRLADGAYVYLCSMKRFCEIKMEILEASKYAVTESEILVAEERFTRMLLGEPIYFGRIEVIATHVAVDSLEEWDAMRKAWYSTIYASPKPIVVTEAEAALFESRKNGARP